MLGGVTNFIAGFFRVGGSNIAPGAFGGTDDAPFSDAEKNFLCSMKATIPDTVDDALFNWFSMYIAGLMGRDVSVVADALANADYCAPKKEAKAPTVKPLPIAFAVDADGYPISTNPVWNACIRGTDLTLDLIKSNPDRVEHRTDNRALTCRDYHKGDKDIWSHPDHANLQFVWNAQTKKLSLPAGYFAAETSVLVQN